MKAKGFRLTLGIASPCARLLLAAALLGGCGGMARRPAPHPETQGLIARGDAAYSRMGFQKAWEAYSKAEALGVRDGVLSYRLDLLREVLKKSRPGETRPHREQTLRLLEEAYRKGNKRPLVYFYLAQAREALGGDGSQKARLYAEAARRFESGKFGPLLAADYEKLGRMYLFLGLAERAERLFLKAQELDPRHALAAYGLGKLYRQTARHREALKQFERFVSILPRDAEGHTLLGESAFAAGEYARAAGALETALSLDSTKGDARTGLRRAREVLARRSKLEREVRELVWEVGFRTRLSPLTLSEDDLRLEADALGPPALGSGRELAFASGEGRRFDLYTLSADGLRLRRRGASASGFTAFLGAPRLLMVAIGFGPGREVGAYDLAQGTFKVLYRGDCRQPHYSGRARALLCAGPQGVLLVDPATRDASTLYREPGVRHPRLSRDGQMVVLAEGEELVWLDRAGEVLGRRRLRGGKAAASFPDISPDGRWIVSGEKGLHLTSVKEETSVVLDHPGLRGAGRAAFGPAGRTLVFVQAGRLHRIALPKEMGSFFAFRRAGELVREKKFSAAVRLLRSRPSGERKRPAYHFLLGRALAGLRLHRDAERAARRAAELDPEDWRPPLLLGKLRAAQKDWSGAVRHLDQAVRMGPNHFEGYLERARVRASRGRYEEAIEDYRLALKRLRGMPEAEAAVLGLLDIYMHKGRVEEALLLLLDRAQDLGAGALDRIRTALRYRPLRADPRFREVLGSASARPAKDGRDGRVATPGDASSKGPAAFTPYRAKIFVDDNPNPVASEVIADDGEEVTIRAFGVIQKYRRERLRIVR